MTQQKYFECNDITFTEGRFYQRDLYSLPYEIRAFLKPHSEEEGQFFYVDLSSAELTLAANFYKDSVLSADIASGNFWKIWLEQFPTMTKEVMKRCLYCMAYSCSDMNFPAGVPASFMPTFTSKYRVWWEGVNRTKDTYEARPSSLVGRYRNWVTGAEIAVPDIREHHASFKVLNFRVQQSLSSYCQILYANVSKQQGIQPYMINFDSLACTYQGRSLHDFEVLVDLCMHKLVNEGKLPCLIPFKTSCGSTLAEAQGK